MQATNNFCNCCGGDFDETGVWMHDSKIWKAAMINTLEQNMKELEERINEKINKPLTSDEILKREGVPVIPLESRTKWYQPIEKPEENTNANNK